MTPFHDDIAALIDDALSLENLAMHSEAELNRHRRNRAKDMRTAWQRYEGDSEPPRVADMLADLMHLCDVEGVDFDHELSMATDFYGDKRAG